MTNIDVVIVNWNSGNQLYQCLDSISKASTTYLKVSNVIVVDNNSNDGSLNNLKNIPIPLQVICNSSNLGFAKACNQGAENSIADYILFLNPDTVLFKKSLDSSVIFMEQKENQKVGICGIQLVDELGKISFTCSRFPSTQRIIGTAFGLQKLFPNLVNKQLMVDWDHQEDREVDQVMGAFFLIRRDLFFKLNGFDNRFFVYYEEVDLALRAKQEGWSSHFISSVQAFHKGGGTTENVQGIALFYYLRSRILYCYKHFDLLPATLALIITVTVELIPRLLRAFFSLSTKQVMSVVEAYYKLYVWIVLSIFKSKSVNTTHS
jgi:N-acetylglucosaminyl-diphospho-decaprenol L-rhamnosyltransferase